MKLTPVLTNFITKYRHRFIHRAFIIDLMCQVANETRNNIVLSPSEYDTLMKDHHVFFTIDKAPDDLSFDKPYSLDEIEANEPELFKHLDEIHKWRAEHSVEMMHREPDVFEFIRTWRNWLVMPTELKELSDTKSQEFLGSDNTSTFKKLFWSYYQDREDKMMRGGDILYISRQNSNDHVFGYLESTPDSALPEAALKLCYLCEDTDKRLISEIDTFTLLQEHTKLVLPEQNMTTTVGRYLLNYLLAEEPFSKTHFTYNNGEWKIDNHHDLLAKEMLRKDDPVTVVEYKRYADNYFFIGNFTELCVPGYTKKSLTTDPNINKLKKELYMANKEKIDKGDPIAIAEMESKLIAADKAYLKGDNCMRFYLPLGGKPFNIARKKSYLTVGGVEEFTKNGGTYKYIDHSLAQGWQKEAIPAITNETRQGSFKRGHETQLGGANSKMIMRVFEDLIISEDDCETNDGMPIDFSSVDINSFIGRYIRLNGKWVVLTSENKSQFDKKQAIIRSPMHCHAKKGLCYKCCGDQFKDLDAKHVAMLLMEVSSKFTTMALKAMHGTKLTVYPINGLDQFILK